MKYLCFPKTHNYVVDKNCPPVCWNQDFILKWHKYEQEVGECSIVNNRGDMIWYVTYDMWYDIYDMLLQMSPYPI
jgi:hypothetical protein